MADKRKCMCCGAEVGEQESYCGSCGTKALDGAVDREEAELKYITPNDENPPHWTMSWRFHDFLTRKFKIYGSELYFRDMLSCFNADYNLLWVYTLVYSFAGFMGKADYNNVYIYGAVNLLFVIILTATVGFIKIVVQKLRNFKKNADTMLYLLCMVRIIACPLYVIILSLFGTVPVYVSIFVMFEVCYGVMWLVICYRYYSKRTKAFIY